MFPKLTSVCFLLLYNKQSHNFMPLMIITAVFIIPWPAFGAGLCGVLFGFPHTSGLSWDNPR